MFVTQALVTGLYGVALTSLAVFWLTRRGVPWQGVARTLVLFLCFPFLMLPAGFVVEFLGLTVFLPLEIGIVPVEEALKLGMIARLGIRGRSAVGICLLFGCVEILSSKASLALVTPLPTLLGWIASITCVVLMHGATGVVYSAIGRVRRRYLFAVATLLHLVNNLGAFWMEQRTETMLQVLGMQMSMVAAIGAAAFLFHEWARGRPVATARADDGDGLAGRAPIV